ncbi:MAG: hypothetical protein ACXVCE_05390 [Bacteriovorax sp.]
MKRYILISVLLTTTSAFANLSNELFTTAQRQDVLRSIDDVCGDTWCEGDYNFKFNDFTCMQSTHVCELNFQFIKRDDNDLKTYSPVQVCRFEKITHFGQLMENKYSLTDSFYEALTDCIGQKEKRVEF